MPSRIALLAGCFNRNALPDEDIKQQLETETKLVTTNPNKPKELPGLVVKDTKSEDTAETHVMHQAAHGQNLSSEESYEESYKEPKGNHRRVHHVNSMHAPSRSYDGIITTSSSSTSAKEPTMDVHVCNSSSCQMCEKNSKGVQFIAASPLCKDTVDALRFLPSSYWNMGGDLYTLNSARTADSDNETTISRASKGSKRNKRSTKLVSSASG
jgi:hypothetical protein